MEEELNNHLSPHSRLYFLSVGCAEGEWINDPLFENQQFPDFLEKYENVPKTIILIDEALSSPTYLESRMCAEKCQCYSKIYFNSFPGSAYICQFDNLEIIVIKSNTLIDYTLENGVQTPTNTTREFFQIIVSHVLFTNSVLIAESFTGTPLDYVYRAMENISPNDKIMYSLYHGGDFGCFSRRCFLSNIHIDFSNGYPVLFNPKCIPIHEIYDRYRNETEADKKKQIAWFVYRSVAKNLLSNAYFVDFLNRKKERNEMVDEFGWQQFIIDDQTKHDLYCLYSNPNSFHDAIFIINSMFRQEYYACCNYLPQTYQLNYPFDTESQKSYQMINKLKTELGNIYDFNSLTTDNII